MLIHLIQCLPDSGHSFFLIQFAGDLIATKQYRKLKVSLVERDQLDEVHSHLAEGLFFLSYHKRKVKLLQKLVHRRFYFVIFQEWQESIWIF